MSDEQRERVEHDIATTGWHLVMVPPEQGTPGWAHTIGLTQRYAHPELIIFGPDLEQIGPLANHLGAGVRGGRTFEPDTDEDGILQGNRLAFRSVAPKWVPIFLGNAAWHYERENLAVLQAFWPDPGGSFPWEEGADPSWSDDQPRLASANTVEALSESMIDVLRREGAL